MRLVSCILAVIVCVAAPAYAQTPGAAYVEFGGSAFMYSVNAELSVGQNRTVRVGGMYLPEFAAAGTVSLNQLIGRGGNYLVLGGGMTFGGGVDTDLNAATATIGYRFMRRDKIFFQIAATPFFTKDGVYPFAGISIGKSY